MPQKQAPSPPQRTFQFIDIQTGMLTDYGINFLEGLWRQIAPGFPIIPCDFSMAANVITLTPQLDEEGGHTYATGLGYWALANATSTGDLTAKVKKGTTTLSTIKVLKTAGAAQATTGDIVSGSVYLFIYHEALDGGAGALVLK